MEVFKFTGNLHLNKKDFASGGTVSFMLGNVSLLYRINKHVQKCNFQVLKCFLVVEKEEGKNFIQNIFTFTTN